MLKVVIADDEVRVCRLVQMLADWQALGMEVVGTASNGLEALEQLETLAPDLLITDIRMPGCDGLELIERARQFCPHLEIVIISGYAQFEYAQTAIRYGVSGYLLKPIQKDALMSTLEKLAQRCRERKGSATAITLLQNDSLKSKELLRERLLDDLLQGRLTAPTPAQLRDEYEFIVQDGVFQIFLLKMDYERKNMSAASLTMLRKKAQETLESMIFPLCHIALLHFQRSAVYGLVHFDPQHCDEMRRRQRDCLNLLQAQKSFFGTVDFTFAIGRVVNFPRELPLSMKQAQNACAERLVEGTGRLQEAAEVSSSRHIRQLLEKYGRVLDSVMDTLSEDEADRAVDSLREAADQLLNPHGYELLELVLAAGKIFVVRCSSEEELLLLNDFNEQCELCNSAGQLFACLHRFQREQLGHMRRQQESESGRPIRLAKQYILQHYREPISLEDICTATGFSVSYFSTLFKKETGEGFAKYLTRFRMEQAKDLLRDTGLAVSEICEQVGYNDLKHFTNNFKKITGLNPGQYRKLYG